VVIFDWESRERAEELGEEVGRCNIHNRPVINRDCPDCEMGMDAEGLEEYGICGECGEYRPEDARVEAGMKCGVCAYA